MLTSTQSIRDLVGIQPSAAAILQRFNIDPCVQADKSLDQACAGLQFSVDQVLEKLTNAATGDRGAALKNPANLSTGRLIQHIVRVHHQRIRHDLPELAAMAHKVADTHGDRAQKLKAVEALVEELRDDLFAHIEKEEQILFSFIAQMYPDASVV